MAETCTFCGSDLAVYDPIVVSETRGDEAVVTGRFCNYACLAEHIEDAGLTEGACCYIDPGTD